jgi:putative FmdB family regulatory protein
MSKLILYDFRCTACGLKFDDMVKSDVFETPCISCGSQSKRLVSCPRLDPRMGLDPDFPTAYDAWAKSKTIKAKTDRAHYKEHGTDRTYGGDVQS